MVLLTYEGVLNLVGDREGVVGEGGRMCEGVWGCFRFEGVDKHREMVGREMVEREVRQRAEGFAGVDRWEIRDAKAAQGEDEVEGKGAMRKDRC